MPSKRRRTEVRPTPNRLAISDFVSFSFTIELRMGLRSTHRDENRFDP